MKKVIDRNNFKGVCNSVTGQHTIEEAAVMQIPPFNVGCTRDEVLYT